MAFDAFWLALHQRRGGAARPGLIALRTIPSSHDLARRLQREYTAEGATPPAVDLFAWEQTAGRGRHGRVWTSPPGGGVYCSLIRELDVLPVADLPLVVPVALAETLRERLDTVRVKWPNDLVAEGRKLGGILLDVSTPAESSPIAVISFGVNIASDLAALAPGATSLAHEMPSTEEDGDALASIGAELVEAVERALAMSAPDVLDRYRAVSVHEVGDTLEARVGDEVIQGVFDGFDDQGFLRLRTDSGERRVIAGELTAGAEPDA